MQHTVKPHLPGCGAMNSLPEGIHKIWCVLLCASVKKKIVHDYKFCDKIETN